MQDEILKNFDQHIFYHGMSYYGAKNIFNKRFREGHGILGSGVYITSNWLVAVWIIYHNEFLSDVSYKFRGGGAILRVNISKGTRILNSAIKPDSKCLQYLRKEFGKDILNKHPRKVIPKNKRLTQREFINLFRYHYWKTHEKNKRRLDDLPHSFMYYLNQSAGTSKRVNFHWRLLNDLMTDLRVQYQFDGFGNPEDDLGIVIFEGNRLEVKEFVFGFNFIDDVNDFEKWLNPNSPMRCLFPDVDHLRKYFQKHGSREAKELAKQIATAEEKKL